MEHIVTEGMLFKLKINENVMQLFSAALSTKMILPRHAVGKTRTFYHV
jgi:hypothetical protein